MLAITRGGMVPAGMLSYRLRLRDILVAAVEYYDDHGRPGPHPDLLPVPGRPAAAREASARRGRGLGQRHDHPRGDRAGSPGGRRTHDGRAPLQADATRCVDEAPDVYAVETSAWVVYPFKAGG